MKWTRRSTIALLSLSIQSMAFTPQAQANNEAFLQELFHLINEIQTNHLEDYLPPEKLSQFITMIEIMNNGALLDAEELTTDDQEEIRTEFFKFNFREVNLKINHSSHPSAHPSEVESQVAQFSEQSLARTSAAAIEHIRERLIQMYREQKSLLRSELGEDHSFLVRRFSGSRLELLREFSAESANSGYIAQKDFSRIIQILSEEIPELQIAEIEKAASILEELEQPLLQPDVEALSAQTAIIPTDEELRTQLSQISKRDVSAFTSWSRERIEATLARISHYDRTNSHHKK